MYLYTDRVYNYKLMIILTVWMSMDKYWWVWMSMDEYGWVWMRID